MKFETRFNVGDEVWVVGERMIDEDLGLCSLCDGEGIVTVKFKETIINCPECRGKGRFKKSKIINTPVPTIVTGVNVYSHRDISVWYDFSSGCSLNGKDVFSNKEECQAKCDEPNDSSYKE